MQAVALNNTKCEEQKHASEKSRYNNAIEALIYSNSALLNKDFKYTAKEGR